MRVYRCGPITLPRHQTLAMPAKQETTGAHPSLWEIKVRTLISELQECQEVA